MTGELSGGTEISNNRREHEPKSVGDVEKTSANSIKVSPNWSMTPGSQPGAWKSNEISRRCSGSLRQTCRKLLRRSEVGNQPRRGVVRDQPMSAERRQSCLWGVVHPRSGQRGQRRRAWGKDQPCVASLGPGRMRESCWGRQGSTKRRCRYRTVAIRQALEGAGKERYRAGHRFLLPMCWQVGSVVDRFRRGSRRLKNQWPREAYPQDSCRPRLGRRYCVPGKLGRVGGRV